MMRWHTIPPLVRKDLRLYFSNRFYTFITVFSLLGMIAAYLLTPRTVDETLRLGVYAPGDVGQAIDALGEGEEGLELQRADSDEALRQLVLDGDVLAGLALPADLPRAIAVGAETGIRPTIALYLPSDAADETRDMLTVMAEGLALALGGEPLAFSVDAVVLGPDRGGDQIPPRDRMRPLFAVMILMLETLGLSALLTEEIETGTIRAILTTPMSVRELFVAKGVTGLVLAFAQALVVMIVVGGMAHQPLLVVLTLLLGSLLVTAVGFLISAAARDMLSVMGIGILVMIVLSIPPIGVAVPGLVTAWARALPSYYVASAVHELTNLGGGWAQVWPSLATLLAFDVVLGALGIAIVRRRFA